MSRFDLNYCGMRLREGYPGTGASVRRVDYKCLRLTLDEDGITAQSIDDLRHIINRRLDALDGMLQGANIEQPLYTPEDVKRLLRRMGLMREEEDGGTTTPAD